MERKRNKIFLCIAVFLSLFLFGCSHTGKVVENPIPTLKTPIVIETKLVTKIIDGDTIVIEGGEHLRLLGIDADERGYECYSEAKKRLEEIVLNKKVELEAAGDDKDQYDRLLRYVFLDDKNINLQLVQEGLAIARFYQEDKYRDEIVAAEKFAIQNRIGCKWRENIEAEADQ